jgi:hypothetical protein
VSAGTQESALPARVETRVRSRGGKDAPALLLLATSSKLGAPQNRLALHESVDNQGSRDSAAAARALVPGVAAAAVSSGGTRVVILLLVLVGVSGALVAAAMRGGR